MFRLVVLIAFMAFLSSSSYAQKWKLLRYDVQGGIGITNTLGDIGGAATSNNLYGLKDISPVNSSSPTFYGGASYKFQEDMDIRLSMVWGTARGTDANSLHASRGYSFSTFYYEPTIQLLYYLIKDTRKGGGAIFDSRGMVSEYSAFSMYAYLGLGGTCMWPKLKYTNQALNPEYESTASFKMSPAFPIGIGIKLGITSRTQIGIDFGPRLMFTDYFDGLTTRFSKFNDIYYNGNIFLIQKIKNDRRGKPIWKRF